MGESEACPAEDAIQALLEYLVDPMLPTKSSVRDSPSLSVAKQMRAAVLLYNYYLRKQHPQLEVLGFEAFCKLAVVLRPPLLAHLKLMQRSVDTELDDLEKQLSETEKRVMEACDISTSLDASKDVPNIEGWPISKVAVLLVNSKRENFILRFSSITEGVWSLIEKDVDISNITSEGVVDAKQANRKPSKDESSVDESSLLQLSYLAVKESTGINQTDLLVLERHAVYSLSKEKTATCFYIMQCTESVHDHGDVIQVPIKDTIDSGLQGPLVRKSSIKWMVTSAVEYFHLFPYAGIVSTWFSREVSSDSLQDLRVGDRNLNVNSQEWTEKPWTPEIHKSQDRSHIGDGLVGGFGNNTKSANTESLKLKDNNGSYMIGLSGSLTGSQNTKNANTESPKQKDDNGGCMIGLSGSLTGPQNRKSANTESPMQKDNNGGCMIGLSGSLSGPQSTKSANTELLKQKDNNGRCMIVLSSSHTGPQNGIVDESFMVPSQNGEKWKNIADTIQADNQQEKMTNCVEGDLNGSPSNVKVKDEILGLMTSPCITESRGKQIAPVNQICENILSVQGGRGDHALVAYQSNLIDLDRLQNTIDIGAVLDSGAPHENPIEPVQDPEVGGSVSGVKVKVEEGECENFGELEVGGCVSVVKVKEEQEWENWENLRSCIEEEMGKVGLVVESGNLGIGGGSDVKKEVVSDVDESESSDGESSDSESSSSSEAATLSSGSSDDDDDEEEEEEDKDKKEVKVEVMTGAGEQGEVEEGEIRDADEQEMVGGTNDDDDDKDMEEDEEEEEIDEDDGKEMVSFSDFDEEEDDEGGAPKGPIKSKHELEVLPPVPPVDATLQPHHPMLPMGVVLSIFGAQVIVEGVEKHNPITEGSILWITESRSPLGLVDEIFGPVKSPYYKVRYNSESEVPSGIQAGSLISFVLEFANHVLNDKDLYKKGYDASGANDEEVLDEAEFSDDEQEAEFKRVQKMTKRGAHDQNVGNMKNNRKKGKNKNGPWKNAQPSPQKPQEQPSNQSKYNFSPSAAFFDRGSSSSSMGQGFVIGTGFIPPFPQTAQTIGFNTPSQKPQEQPSNQSQHNFLPSASFFDRGSSSSSMGQGFVIGTGCIPPFPQTAQTIGFNTPSQKPQEQPSNQSQYNFSPSAAFFDRGSSSSSMGQGFVIGTGCIPPFPQTAQTIGFNTPSNGVWTNGMPFQPPHNAVFPNGFPTNGMPWFSQNPNQHPCQMPMPNRMPFQQQFDPSQTHPTAMFPAVGPTFAQGLVGQNGFNQSPFGMGLQGQHTHPLMNMGMNVGDQGILSNGLQVQQNSMQQSAFAPGNFEAAQQFNMCASSHCGRNPYHRGGGRFVGVRGWQQSK